MVEIFGELYYIDLDKVTETSELEVETVEPKEGEEDSMPRHDQTINVFKYDIVKQCIDTLLTEGGGGDDKMGLLASDISIPFKFAFNTLINYGILVKNEYE